MLTLASRTTNLDDEFDVVQGDFVCQNVKKVDRKFHQVDLADVVGLCAQVLLQWEKVTLQVGLKAPFSKRLKHGLTSHMYCSTRNTSSMLPSSAKGERSSSDLIIGMADG